MPLFTGKFVETLKYLLSQKQIVATEVHGKIYSSKEKTLTEMLKERDRVEQNYTTID